MAQGEVTERILPTLERDYAPLQFQWLAISKAVQQAFTLWCLNTVFALQLKQMPLRNLQLPGISTFFWYSP